MDDGVDEDDGDDDDGGDDDEGDDDAGGGDDGDDDGADDVNISQGLVRAHTKFVVQHCPLELFASMSAPR